METTRHFVATVYVVHNDAVALHSHDGLDMWLPPGGHVERDELPHETAHREVTEELGLDVELVASRDDLESDTVRSLPRPQHFLLEDIDVLDGDVGHQHVDFIFYGAASDRKIAPDPGEQPAGDWYWFSAEELTDFDELTRDVEAIAREAIDSVDVE